MTRQQPSMGFLGRFGRSPVLRRIDEAFRALDVHPNIVPEAVKIAMVNLLGDGPGSGSEPETYRAAAEIVAYCMIGEDGFAGANGERLARDIETRIEAAVDAGDSIDARLILLTLHAGIIQPGVVERYGLETG